MALDAGATVGRYKIQGLLGSGGMGEVYKAADSTLNRPVALKVLRPELGRDPERLSRFLHEARAASALNHPNILTIHEVGDHDQSRFLVSEFVEGETLRQRVARGQLTLREILDIMIQTASALSAAHAASIVHRDIKPDNLMLRPDGYVKVLDFGVATMVRSKASADAMATVAATVDAPETGAGMIVGTIAYMSPEQARGLPVDGRSDCYSLAWCSTSWSPAGRPLPHPRRRTCWWRFSSASRPPFAASHADCRRSLNGSSKSRSRKIQTFVTRQSPTCASICSG